MTDIRAIGFRKVDDVEENLLVIYPPESLSDKDLADVVRLALLELFVIHGLARYDVAIRGPQAGDWSYCEMGVPLPV
jgi:hypothetical protein